jgi:hypothetical protein
VYTFNHSRPHLTRNCSTPDPQKKGSSKLYYFHIFTLLRLTYLTLQCYHTARTKHWACRVPLLAFEGCGARTNWFRGREMSFRESPSATTTLTHRNNNRSEREVPSPQVRWLQKFASAFPSSRNVGRLLSGWETSPQRAVRLTSCILSTSRPCSHRHGDTRVVPPRIRGFGKHR